MVWSHGMNPSSISQQFNWSHQLMIVFLCTSRGSPYDLEAILTTSAGQETVFVERTIVLFDLLKKII